MSTEDVKEIFPACTEVECATEFLLGNYEDQLEASMKGRPKEGMPPDHFMQRQNLIGLPIWEGRRELLTGDGH